MHAYLEEFASECAQQEPPDTDEKFVGWLTGIAQRREGRRRHELAIDRRLPEESLKRLALGLCHDLGQVITYGLGEAKKAIGFYEQALQIDRAVFGDQHPKLARYNNLGAAWSDLGEAAKAIGFYEQALQIDLAVFGDQHPDTAIDYNNLGMAWQSLDDVPKARDYLEKALRILNDVYGADHPRTQTARANLQGLGQ